MSCRRRRLAPSRSDDERGAVLVLAALTMVVLLIVTAIVIDLGYARGGAGFDQSSADLAALAGGDALAERDYVEACQNIVSYINSNTRAAFSSAGLCAGFAGTVCSGGSAAQVTPTATSGRYDVSIRFPVPDAEIADATFGAGRIDGLPCERMRVVITSRQPSFFGGIAGASEYSVTRTATIRGGDSQTRLVPSLWLLDPVGCTVLSVQGGSQVTAGDVSNPADPNPGVITLDSDGSAGCSATKPTLDAGGSGTEIRAVPLTGGRNQRGEISLVALPFNAISCDGSVACKQSQVVSGQVSPQPIPAEERATRAPVDWLWNCQETYPNYLSVPIEGCPATDEREPYIDQLIAAVGGPNTLPDASYQRWSDFHSCNAASVEVSGNWWVDCPTPGGLSIGNNTVVTFKNGNVVFEGGIKLNGNGVLNVNTANTTANLPVACVPPGTSAPCVGSASDRAAFIYVRDGDWSMGSGTFRGDNTMVYLSPDSEVKSTAGSLPDWTAPTEGPFAGLALWAESPAAFNVSGGAGVRLQGTFFTPFAELSLSGGGNWGQQNAQFISYRLVVSGGSILTMAPDPTTAANLPPPQATLIR